MREENINGHIVLIEDDISELSVKRFQKYNKFLLVDSGVGGDLSDICRHADKAITLIKANPDMAVTEIENLKQAMFLVSSELSPKYMAFACLVMRIDGQPISDLSDENLKGIVTLLSGEKHRLLDDIIGAVKKKIEEALSTYFPSKFERAETKEYYDDLKKLTLLQLRTIMGEDTRKERDYLEVKMAMLIRPKCFVGSNSAEVQYDKEYEDLCLLISKELNADPKSMTVLEYYNAIEYIKRMQNERKKQIEKTKR